MRGQFNLTLPLLINKSQRIISKAELLLMRINKWIYGKSIFRLENEIICKSIGNILPEQEILHASAKFIHKFINQKEKSSINDYIGRPTHSTSNIFHKNPKKKLYKTAFQHHLHLYYQIQSTIK